MRRRLLAAGLAAALGVGVARGDPPPVPPRDHPVRILDAGAELRLRGGEVVTVPKEGGLYLDPEAWRFQVEKQRYYEVRIKVAEEVAERSLWKGIGLGFGVGVAVGGLVALVRGRP